MSDNWIISLIICAVFFLLMVFAILRAGAEDDQQVDESIKNKFTKKG
ncbi:MAG: hypothetical protein WC940_03070 [Candidatus Paceibacterota bacterium]|jgi:preprotein translocase subunit YajC